MFALSIADNSCQVSCMVDRNISLYALQIGLQYNTSLVSSSYSTDDTLCLHLSIVCSALKVSFMMMTGKE